LFSDALPILVAGGGFHHGKHLAFDARDNLPFANLLATIARHVGVELESFGSSTATSIEKFQSS
jgi:hypothetical protein